MTKVVDFQAGRSRHEHKDERAARLKEDLRAARETPPQQDAATRRLLEMFKRKPAPKP
jgi:hypothetical protein